MLVPVKLLWLVFFISTIAHAQDCDYLPSPPDAGHVSGNGITAWFGGPTTRYGHGVLGDAIEATTLYVKADNAHQCALALTLEAHSVFEDVTPRLADVTGDGRENIVAIESHAEYGASLAIYGIVDAKLVKVASSPYIGKRYRWLAPIGTADFNGDGTEDVALIQTPHLAGIIKIWSFANPEPELLASKAGFSNHRIGENFITGGVSICNGQPRLVIPDISWSGTMVVEFKNNALNASRVAENTTTDTIDAYLQCR